jgi:hypothetical protein
MGLHRYPSHTELTSSGKIEKLEATREIEKHNFLHKNMFL